MENDKQNSEQINDSEVKSEKPESARPRGRSANSSDARPRRNNVRRDLNKDDRNQESSTVANSRDEEVDQAPDSYAENKASSSRNISRKSSRNNDYDDDEQDYVEVDNKSEPNRRNTQRSNQRDRYENTYEQRPYQQPNKSIVPKIVIALSVIAIIGVGLFAYSKMKGGHDDEVLMVKIVSVTPNYTTVETPTVNCRDVTSSKQVANPNRNFFNGVFDSKNHPKYVTQTSTKKVCENATIESQVLENYTIQYQIKNSVESMIVNNPPAVNAVMPVQQLQQYVESAAPASGQDMNSNTTNQQTQAPNNVSSQQQPASNNGAN